MSRSSASSARTSPDRPSAGPRAAAGLLLLALAVAVATVGCEPIEPLTTTQPEATTQPASDDAPSMPGPASPPATSGVDDAPALDAPDDPTPPVAPAGGMVPVGPPPGAKVEFKIPGTGAAPAAGDAAVRQRAGMQAAIFVAIYNVTHEINDVSYRDEIEDGYVASDDFRYHDGLEVKSQTVVVRGLVKRFDIWLVVPAGEGDGQDKEKFEVRVRNFTLIGPPLSQAQLDRLFRTAGGHLVVMGVDGPDEKGLYTAEVGLVRDRKKPPAPPR